LNVQTFTIFGTRLPHFLLPVAFNHKYQIKLSAYSISNRRLGWVHYLYIFFICYLIVKNIESNHSLSSFYTGQTQDQLYIFNIFILSKAFFLRWRPTWLSPAFCLSVFVVSFLWLVEIKRIMCVMALFLIFDLIMVFLIPLFGLSLFNLLTNSKFVDYLCMCLLSHLYFPRLKWNITFLTNTLSLTNTR